MRKTPKNTLFVAVAVAAALAAGAFFAWRSVISMEHAEITRGRELAQLLCARCHAIGPAGDSTNPGAPPFRTLEEKLTLEGVEDQIAEGLSLGHEPMPPWQFSSQQIVELVSYIASLSERTE